MKVCTDACIFGAWVAEKVAPDSYRDQLPLPDWLGQAGVASCLEVGAGTGLLSLMYAQKNSNAIIDAVEIEKNAYEQVKENFSNSKWNDRLKIFHTDIKYFVSQKNMIL